MECDGIALEKCFWRLGPGWRFFVRIDSVGSRRLVYSRAVVFFISGLGAFFFVKSRRLKMSYRLVMREDQAVNLVPEFQGGVLVMARLHSLFCIN
jgi:hypothetical protein